MSAKELNIGDYVRTECGIAKIESFELKNKEIINLDKDIMFCNMDIYRNCCSINQVIKSSSNIIDLIEVGDILKFKDDKEYQQVKCIEEDKLYLTGYIQFELQESKAELQEEIEWIITHEQLERCEYKL